MSPRPGGEADKIGNRYEGAWTVNQLLQVLADEVDWVRVEPLGDLGDGAEFILRRRDGVEEAHQVKRQRANENEWSVSALTGLGVWGAARHHVASQRDYHLISMVPFRRLQELTDRARSSHDYVSFVRGGLPEALNTLFVTLSGVYDTPEEAWTVLRGFYVRLVDEELLRRTNAALAGVFLEGGSGLSITASLGDAVDNNIDAILTSDRLLQVLRPYDIRRRPAASQQGLTERIHNESRAWLRRIGQQLMRPVIVRTEAEKLRVIPAQSERVHFLIGAAGGGKTAVLHQAVDALLADGVPTLVLRLDRYGALPSTSELGRQLGLDVSPVTALAAAAGEEPAVLIVDQLDAVSLASGRLPENFDVVSDLVAEAMAIPNLRVILGCRQFDVDNDHRIRNLRTSVKPADVIVEPLSDDQIDAALSSLGLTGAVLTSRQRGILRLPLHLSLLASIADQANALDFSNSQRLFDVYWEHKRQAVEARRQGTKFNRVIGRLAEAMSERQRLQVPASLLDADELGVHAAVLVSEQLLVRDGTQLGFFHEALFDYAFARQWVNRGGSLVEFLAAGEQELFRRAQVRQIMVHLRGSDELRFLDEVRELLSGDQVRFHIKDVALAVLGDLGEPTGDEAAMLIELARNHPKLADRLWSRLTALPWFQRFDVEGYIAGWFVGNDEDQNRALTLMAGVANSAPDRLAELLAQHAAAPSYPGWLRWVAWRADLSQSRSLFDLFLDGVRSGYYEGFEEDMWLSVHDLSEQQPGWAVDLLVAFLTERAGTLDLTERGRVALLEGRSYQAVELVNKAAAGAPKAYLNQLLPYLLQVVAITARQNDQNRPVQDAQFSHRLFKNDHSYANFDDALYLGMASTIQALVAVDPDGMRTTLETLAVDPHDSVQWLLYQGLLAGGVAYADWAAELLLQGPHRLICGHLSNSVWTTREVLQAISPYVSDDLFQRLEVMLRDLRFPWESRPPGWYAFNLLSALDEQRLSETGHRRLGELRRVMGAEQPPQPEGITSGFIGPPIASASAQRMSDDNWLRAMAKHAADRENWRDFTGGARELAQVLKTQTIADPLRFAHLALRLTPNINAAYADAVLMGFAEAEVLEDAAPIFEAVRHVANLGLADTNRWLGHSLRHYTEVVPLDVVELILDRALNAADPVDNDPRFRRQNDKQERNDLWSSGINTARGSLAETLGDLLIVDVDGSRTALVAPHLPQLASDPVASVRTGVANVVAGALRYARPQAVEAFAQLVDCEDLLLATHPVVRLMMYLGADDPAIVRPVIQRMLVSSEGEVREAAGELTMYGAMQWNLEDLLPGVLAGADDAARKGAAAMAAHRLADATNSAAAESALSMLFNDPSAEVRAAAAEVAGALRGHALRPFETVLQDLTSSLSFRDALAQLLYTLEHAPDRIDDMVLLCAQRFVAVLGGEAGDIRTGTAGDARHVGQLVIRGLAQSRSADDRAALLDVLDGLLRAGAYGIEELITESERPL